jgi:hypothetical protein
MMLLRLALCSLIAFLVLTPCLGFAAGDGALGHWTRHHRTARAPHTDSSPLAWKTTPGVLPHLSPPGVLGLAGSVAVRDVVVAPSLALRPPFVPPRT